MRLAVGQSAAGAALGVGTTPSATWMPTGKRKAISSDAHPAPTITNKNPARCNSLPGLACLTVGLARMPSPISVADFKSPESGPPSTAHHYTREYWREHGVSWRSLFDLHVAIVNRLQAASSSWLL